METTLSTYTCFGARFRFVLHIEQSRTESNVRCRAEIFERSQVQAVLELAEGTDRMAIADKALSRCISWAEQRMRQAP